MEIILAYSWVFWIAVAIVALIIEVNTAALVSIWFVPSAICAAVLSLVFDNFAIECLAFFILSVIFLIISRTVYKKYIKPTPDEGDKSLTDGRHGKTVEVTGPESGKVIIGDVYWKAKTEGETISEDTDIVVIKSEGTTLTVKKL